MKNAILADFIMQNFSCFFPKNIVVVWQVVAVFWSRRKSGFPLVLEDSEGMLPH